MRKILYILLILTIPFSLIAQNQLTKDYVQKYKGIAIREMKRTGIPASITLAQGILESASGESNLAKKFNNHFGIKCKAEWKGETTYQDDDTKNECFRVYPNADSSYRDHSNFLKYRPYYASLFELDPVDDTAWAYGLKKAGYATERDYPSKLLKIIDDYELAQYNYPELVAEDSIAEVQNKLNKKTDTTVIISKETNNKTESNFTKDSIASVKIVEVKPEKNTPQNTNPSQTESPSLNKITGISGATVNSAPAPVMRGLGETQKETIKEIQTKDTSITKVKSIYPLNQKFRINQVPAIWAEKGRSILEIANTYNIPLFKIYKYNELPETDLIEEDQIVFLAEKKKESSKKIHIAKLGETFYSISQTEGVQLAFLQAYNATLTDAKIKEGVIVYMFSVPKETTIAPKPSNTSTPSPKTLTPQPPIKTTDSLKSKSSNNKIKHFIKIPFLKNNQ